MSKGDAYDILATMHGYGQSSRYRQVLECLMTPVQAKLACQLPASPEELAQRLGLKVEAVKEELDKLYRKGVIFPKNFETREGYRFARGVIQFHDATLSDLRSDVVAERELYRLWDEFCHFEWYPYWAKAELSRTVRRLRVIPAYRAINDIPGVLPYEDMRQIVKAAYRIAVVACACRQRTRAMGNECGVSGIENCLQMNRGAEYSISRGSGREVSYDEAMAIVDATEDDGLIHSYWNSSAMSYIVVCNCCADCCEGWVSLKENNVPVGLRYAKSRYQAQINQGACTGCQICVDRCQFDAIEMVKPQGSKKHKAVIDPEKCWGCGNCVLGCEPGALSMSVVRPPEHIPERQDSPSSPYVPRASQPSSGA